MSVDARPEIKIRPPLATHLQPSRTDRSEKRLPRGNFTGAFLTKPCMNTEGSLTTLVIVWPKAVSALLNASALHHLKLG